MWTLPTLFITDIHGKNRQNTLQCERSSGSPLSRLNSKIHAINRSVIHRLTSRSLSGQILCIQVHQHLGFRLCLIWQPRREWNKKQKLITQEMCIEKKFVTDDDIENFCYDLERNTLEGFCSCVCDLGLVPFLEEKTHPFL